MKLDRPASWPLLLVMGLGGMIAILATAIWYWQATHIPMRESPAYLVAAGTGLIVVELAWIVRVLCRQP